MNEQVPAPETTIIRMIPVLVKGADGKFVEKIFNRDKFLREFDLDDIVRMPAGDFPNIEATPGTFFSHFNIEKTVNKSKREDGSPTRYLIAMIAGPGQPEPLLTLEKALLATCADSESNVSYDQLKTNPKYLQRSLKGLEVADSLLATMLKRYGPGSSRNLPPQKVIDAGAGWSLFKILGPAAESSQSEGAF